MRATPLCCRPVVFFFHLRLIASLLKKYCLGFLPFSKKKVALSLKFCKSGNVRTNLSENNTAPQRLVGCIKNVLGLYCSSLPISIAILPKTNL